MDEINVDGYYVDVDLNCDLPIQCEFIGEHENRSIVAHNLKEDEKLFTLITTLATKIVVKLVGNRIWFTIINNGGIIQYPYVYLYFLNLFVCEKMGMRIVSVGFICWSRGIYATIDIEFYIYPTKLPYVQSTKAWRLPHSAVTQRIEIMSADQQLTVNP
jgi:hypothetical protein